MAVHHVSISSGLAHLVNQRERSMSMDSDSGQESDGQGAPGGGDNGQDKQWSWTEMSREFKTKDSEQLAKLFNKYQVGCVAQ